MALRRNRRISESPDLNKPVKKLPGIGAAYIRTLEENGFATVQDVYNMLKVLEFDKIKFQQRMKNECGILEKYSSEAFDCLKDWKDQFEDKPYPICMQPLSENE